MYSAYKLNKQGDNIQPWHTPFPIWNQSVVPCPVLLVASWPAYRFLKRWVRWSGMPISFRVFQFIVIHIVKGFGIVNKAEIDVFLELSCFFNDPEDVDNLISGSKTWSKSWSLDQNQPFLKPAWTSGNSWFRYCWSLAWRILNITRVWDECNCAVVWAFLGIAFLWDWNENWPFPGLWPLLRCPNLLAYWVQHFHSIIFQDLK